MKKKVLKREILESRTDKNSQDVISENTENSNKNSNKDLPDTSGNDSQIQKSENSQTEIN